MNIMMIRSKENYETAFQAGQMTTALERMGHRVLVYDSLWKERVQDCSCVAYIWAGEENGLNLNSMFVIGYAMGLNKPVYVLPIDPTIDVPLMLRHSSEAVLTQEMFFGLVRGK